MNKSPKLDFATARRIIEHRLTRLEKDGADPEDLPAELVKLSVALALEVNGLRDTLDGLALLAAQLDQGATGSILADLAPVGNA